MIRILIISFDLISNFMALCLKTMDHKIIFTFYNWFFSVVDFLIYFMDFKNNILLIKSYNLNSICRGGFGM